MGYFMHLAWISLFTFLSLISKSHAVSMASAACGACTMVVTEMELKIAELEEKKRGKTYKQSNGMENQNFSKVSFSRSEIQLSEVLETVCDKTSEWTAVIHPRTGKGVYARHATLKLKQAPKRLTIHQFGDACSDFLDSYEDQLIKFASQKREEPVREFCHRTIEVCTAVDVTPMTDDESGKARVLSPEEKEKAVEKALNNLKKNAKRKDDL